MINLVLFYILFIIYNVYLVVFLLKKVREIKLQLEGIDKNTLKNQFMYITRNILSVTIIVFLICSLLLSTINYEKNMTPPQIGLALSIATTLFFIIFLIWDILKHKLIDYFYNKFSIIIKDVILERLHFFIIVLYTIILLLTIFSIISLLLI